MEAQMTLDEVRDRLNKIEGMAGDSEMAHYEQDSLYLDVLDHIAKNATDNDIRRMAANALLAEDIKFERWYA